jgi:hypothetical protein
MSFTLDPEVAEALAALSLISRSSRPCAGMVVGALGGAMVRLDTSNTADGATRIR